MDDFLDSITPLTFWVDLTYALKKIAAFFKKIFGSKDED